MCGRCLVVLNTTSPVRARTPGGELASFEHPTDVPALKAWVIEKILDGQWSFEIGPLAHCFVPIATWHGDPVCVYHLYVLAEMERRGIR